MPDLAYGDLVQSARSSSSSQTNALAIIPVASSYKNVELFKPYCTIDDVKAYIRNSEYDDGFYAQAINQASRMVEKFTQKNFWFHNHRVTPFRPKDIFENKVFFPFPIRSISSLTIDGYAVTSDSYHYVSVLDSVESRNYYIEMEFVSEADLTNLAGVRLLNEDPNQTPKKVLVKGEFGYRVGQNDEFPIDPLFPAEVRRATTMIAGTLTDQFRREVVDKEGNKQNLLETMIPYDAIKLLKMTKRCVL